jgi:poly-gamma-glutamate synthesis protein (capsule biosynthesis protein)
VTITLALAGDTMLGRKVAERLRHTPPSALFSPELVELVDSTDGLLVNLECCISTRGLPWPGRAFHFRAPPEAVEALAAVGTRCVSLANNHALDFGVEALTDTIEHLEAAGIAVAGAGHDEHEARGPASFDAGGLPVTVVAFADHPDEYAATPRRPGTAYAPLGAGVPDWLISTVTSSTVAPGPLVVSPHWGPNMTTGPASYIRAAADELVAAGASLVAGHSAHVFHGARDRVLYDLGDFIDDYATDPYLRNDLGVLWLVTFDGRAVVGIEAVPLHLDYCRTELARGEDAALVSTRLRAACEVFGTRTGSTARGVTVGFGSS